MVVHVCNRGSRVSAIPALARLRQEDREFQDSLEYQDPVSKTKTDNKNSVTVMAGATSVGSRTYWSLSLLLFELTTARSLPKSEGSRREGRRANLSFLADFLPSLHTTCRLSAPGTLSRRRRGWWASLWWILQWRAVLVPGSYSRSPLSPRLLHSPRSPRRAPSQDSWY
jgi:hypothetical protein